MSELSQLPLLAEVDLLLGELHSWSQRAPDWPASRVCQTIVRRLSQRAETLRVRLEAPLVVATLGGTGTGKSSLVNALVGAEVTQAGRQRPTTMRPTLISRPQITPAMLGIDPASVEWVPHDTPALRDLVLLDCPDPDTTEQSGEALPTSDFRPPTSASTSTNLARLRSLLPHCDVLLVTSTQQKYRSARVAEELASAAPGARLVFVQTHADQDDDVRDDWRQVLAEQYATGEMFFVDSLAAFHDAQAGLQPRGEFARLVELLTQELAGAAGQRIRRANFLDLVEQALEACRERIDAALPSVEALETAINEQRARLAAKLAGQMREELLTSRRQWEHRLLAEVASRWGFSPFSLVLRAYLGLGSLLSSALLLRARSPAQMALWGALQGGQILKRRRQSQQADEASSRAVAWSWDEGELRTAAIIIDGYAAEAGLSRTETHADTVARHAQEVGVSFINNTAAELQKLLRRQAARHTGVLTRWRYELLLAVMLVALLYRLARNFFYDSWLGPDLGLTTHPQPLLGTDFFLQALFWLLVWCTILLWLFTLRLRRGLRGEINELAQQWSTPALVSSLFRQLETTCRQIHHFRQDRERLAASVVSL